MTPSAASDAGAASPTVASSAAVSVRAVDTSLQCSARWADYPSGVGPDDPAAARRRLVRLLQGAYSGELAACYAYQGHARSVSDPREKQRIAEIEHEEWVHRECVGKMLASLGEAPDP